MTKITNPYLRTSTRTWFCKIDGKPKQLGPKGASEAEARAAYSALIIQLRGIDSSREEAVNSQKAANLIRYYLQRQKGQTTDSAWADKAWFLNSFAAALKERPLSDVRPLDIADWLDAHDRWGNNTRALACRILNTCFRWFQDNDLAQRNPVQRVKRPVSTPRGEEYALTEDDYLSLLAECPRRWEGVLAVLWASGARPSEILRLRKDEVDLVGGIIRKKEHKNKKRGKKREILLTTPAREIIEQAMQRNSSEWVFPCKTGKPVSMNTFCKLLKDIRDKLGLLRPCVPYSFRHGFAVRHLRRGISLTMIARWLGDTVAVAERHYGHVADGLEHTRGWLEKGP